MQRRDGASRFLQLQRRERESTGREMRVLGHCERESNEEMRSADVDTSFG